jgi:hypothetical protein
VSTQLAVTPGAKAAPMAVNLAWAGWIGIGCRRRGGGFCRYFRRWRASCGCCCGGSGVSAGAGAVHLTALEWPALGRSQSRFGLACRDFGAGCGNRGWSSPLAVALLVPVIMARTLGRWTRIAGIGAVLGYGAAGLSALMYAGLGRFTVVLTMWSLLLAADGCFGPAARPRRRKRRRWAQRIAEVSPRAAHAADAHLWASRR